MLGLGDGAGGGEGEGVGEGDINWSYGMDGYKGNEVISNLLIVLIIMYNLQCKGRDAV